MGRNEGNRESTSSRVTEAAPMRSPLGKEILAYASGQEYCILEFAEMDDGSMRVAVITDHVRALEDEVYDD